MAVQKDDDSNEETKREGVMGLCLVGFVERVRFAELLLVVFQLLLLLGRQNGEFPLLLRICWVYDTGSRHRSVFGRKVVMIGKFGKHLLLTARPGEVVVVSDVNHVVGVYGTEGCETISHNSEKGNKDTVNDVDDVDLLATDIDPADEEKHPGQTEQGDEGRVESDKEAKSCDLSVMVCEHNDRNTYVS